MNTQTSDTASLSADANLADEPAAPAVEAAKPAADTTDVLTRSLPPSLHHPVRQLVLSAGFDLDSAIVSVLSALACWCGTRLRVRVAGEVDAWCMTSTVIGLPTGTSPEVIESVITERLAQEEAGIVGRLAARRAGLSVDIRKRSIDSAPFRTLVHNQRASVIQSVCNATEAEDLLITQTDNWWVNVLKVSMGQAELTRNALKGAYARTIFRFQPEPPYAVSKIQTKVALWATLPASFLEEMMRHENYQIRTVLAGGIHFCARYTSSAVDDAALRAGGVHDWDRVLAQASLVRAGEAGVITPDTAAAEKLTAWRTELEQLVRLAPLDDFFQVNALINLPARFFGTLEFAAQHRGDSAARLELAFHLARFLRDQMLAKWRCLSADRLLLEERAHTARLLEKITYMGPVSFRNLVRTENYQPRDYHMPRIAELIKEKLVEVDAEGRYKAAGAAAVVSGAAPFSR